MKYCSIWSIINCQSCKSYESTRYWNVYHIRTNGIHHLAALRSTKAVYRPLERLMPLDFSGGFDEESSGYSSYSTECAENTDTEIYPPYNCGLKKKKTVTTDGRANFATFYK